MTEIELDHFERAVDFLQRAGEAATTNPIEADRLLLVAGCHARLSQSQALRNIAQILDDRLTSLGPKWHGISETT